VTISPFLMSKGMGDEVTRESREWARIDQNGFASIRVIRGRGRESEHALRSGAAIITKDEDFSDRAKSTSEGPVIIWL
jgi:hypothetical protein